MHHGVYASWSACRSHMDDGAGESLGESAMPVRALVTHMDDAGEKAVPQCVRLVTHGDDGAGERAVANSKLAISGCACARVPVGCVPVCRRTQDPTDRIDLEVGSIARSHDRGRGRQRDERCRVPRGSLAAAHSSLQPLASRAPCGAQFWRRPSVARDAESCVQLYHGSSVEL